MANGGLSFRALRQPGRTSAPAVNEYQGQGGRGSLGRITSAFQGGSVASSLTGPGGGLASLAQGLKDLGAVFEQQEEERQRLEAIEAMSAAQDEERAMFEQMSQMTGSAGYAAPELAGKFYQDLEGRVMKGARGDFQRGVYAKALAGMRDQGLNQAVSYRLREHENYKGQVYDGQQARLDSQIMADPANVGIYTSQKINNLRLMYPNAAPEWIAAKSDELANKADLAAFESILATGDEAAAGAYLQRVYTSMPTSSRGGQRVRGAEFALPTDNHHYITSPFGPRTAPTKGASTTHNAIDLSMPVGTPVKSIADGTVTFVGVKGGYGTAVIVRHGDGTTSQYSHLSKGSVAVGDKVTAGSVIALSGDSGTSTGPHLDLKIAKNGQYVDPAPLLGISRGGKLSGALETTAAKERPIMLASLGGGPININAPGIEDDEEPEFVEAEFTAEAGDEAASGAVVMPPGYGGRVPPRQLLQMQTMLNKHVNARAKAEDAERKRLGNEAQKDMTTKWYTEGLNMADVVNNRDYLSPADFDKHMARAMNGIDPPSNSDRDFLIEMREKAGRRDPDYQATLDEGFRNLKVTPSDYSSLSTLGEKFREPTLKQAEQIIKLKTGRSEMNPNPAADLSYLQAVADYDAWLDSDAGQKASDKERLDMANRVGDNYRLINLENNLLGVSAPLFLVGSRTSPDIQATAVATKKALDTGQITPEQYQAEAIRIKRLYEIIQSQAAATVTSQGKNNR